MINPRIDGGRSPLAVRLGAADVVALDTADERRAAAWREAAARAARAGPAQCETVFHCGGGLNSFAIDPYGRLGVCVLARRETYDLRAGTFHDGWERFLRAVRERPRSRAGRCAACSLRRLCEMCAACGELENGDPESPVEYICAVTRERARALGLQSLVSGVGVP
jgi:radical SAM protein with 4Fe4S-binding SPASM domain